MASFKKFQPVGLRLWHALNALVVTSLLLTVLLRRTLFNMRLNQELLRTKAAAAGHSLDPKVAKALAEALTDHLWEWHVYLGYGLTALILA